MYVYELMDHQTGKIIGIYTSMQAATQRVYALTGRTISTRYRVWSNYVRHVIYEPDLDCMYQEDPREREFDDEDVNAVPF